MSKIYDWFEERLEVQAIADDISSKYVPPHVNIFYCFGGLVFTCFLIQVATGKKKHCVASIFRILC